LCEGNGGAILDKEGFFIKLLVDDIETMDEFCA
jgi:hypothetical protein